MDEVSLVASLAALLFSFAALAVALLAASVVGNMKREKDQDVFKDFASFNPPDARMLREMLPKIDGRAN